MATKYVLVALPLSRNEMDQFAGSLPDAGFVFCKPGDVPDVKVRAADIIIGNIAPWLLNEAPYLSWVQLSSSGADRYLAPGILPERVTLTSATGAFGPAVSEHMLAMILEAMKKLHLYRDDQHSHSWEDEGSVTSLDGAHVLVLGTGDIGSHFARLAHALGSEVRGIRRHAGHEAPAPFEEVGTLADLPEMLPWADVVLSCLPSTPETRGLADNAFFGHCREGAIFANCGRGDLVVNADLALALASGRLSAACLDVTDPEPLPKESALWSLRNCIITPHVSGFYHLPATRDRVVAICLDNLRRYAAGRPLRNVRRAPREKLGGAAGAQAGDLPES